MAQVYHTQKRLMLTVVEYHSRSPLGPLRLRRPWIHSRSISRVPSCRSQLDQSDLQGLSVAIADLLPAGCRRCDLRLSAVCRAASIVDSSTSGSRPTGSAAVGFERSHRRPGRPGRRQLPYLLRCPTASHPRRAEHGRRSMRSRASPDLSRRLAARPCFVSDM